MKVFVPSSLCVLLICGGAFREALAAPVVLSAKDETNKKSVTMVTVRQVVFTGNTVFSAEELRQVVMSAPKLEGPGLEFLKSLAARVEAYYHARGYPNAKVIIPEQEVKGGRVTFQVLEPKLGQIQIRGNKRYSEAFLRRSFSGIDYKGILRVKSLERKLLIVSEYPGLQARATLQAGTKPGTTDVVIDLTEASRLVTARTEVNNFGSRQTSRERVSQQVTLGNLTGRGDALTLGLISAFNPSDLLYGQLHYTAPLNPDGANLSFDVMGGDFEIGEEFAVLGMKGRGLSVGLSVLYPLVKRSDRSVTLEAGLESTDSLLKVLGRNRYYDQTRTLKLGVHVDDRDARTKTRNAGSAMLHLGLGEALGGMSNNDPSSSRAGADDSFAKLVLDFTHVQQLTERSFLVASLGGQLTTQPLVAGEQFSIGGADSVRGYPESEWLGDNGWRLNLEYRYTPHFNSHPDWLEDLQVVSFLDYGRISNKRPVPGQPHSKSLTGIGLGLRAALTNQFFVRADLGYGLSSRPSYGGRLQPYVQVAHEY